MANVTVGAFVANELLAPQARAAGTLAFGPVAIPTGFSHVVVMFDLRQQTTATAAFSATLSGSLDNGATWTAMGGAGLDLPAGLVLTSGHLYRSESDPLGPGVIRTFGFGHALPRTELTTRQIKGTVSCTESSTLGVTVVVW